MDYRKFYKDYYGIDFGPEYDVHHIDRNRSNNDIQNLLLLPTRLHHQLHWVNGVLSAYCTNKSFIGIMIEATNPAYLSGAFMMAADICIEIQSWVRSKDSENLRKMGYLDIDDGYNYDQFRTKK